MTTIDNYAEHASVIVSHRSTITEFLAKVRAGITDGREMEARYDRLSRMSNSELTRRGLSRNEITRAVATERVFE